MSLCPCGSGRPYEECCETYIEGRETAPTAEALMRSRYAAHTLGKYDYLNETVHPSIRDEADHEDMKKWSEAVEWEGLEIFSTKDGAETDETGEVSFEARYSVNGMPQSLREDAFFRREDGRWYYVDGNVHGQDPYRREPSTHDMKKGNFGSLFLYALSGVTASTSARPLVRHRSYS